MSSRRGQGYVYKRGNVWWIAYSIAGKKYQESSRSRSHAEAVRLLTQRLAERGRGLSRRDLEKVTLLPLDPSYMERMPATRHWFDWQIWLATVGAGDVKLGSGLRFNDYNLAVQAAIAGQGVVLGSWLIVKNAIRANLLVSPFAERARTDVGYDLATTTEAMARPEVARFVEWILEETDAEGPWQPAEPSAT